MAKEGILPAMSDMFGPGGQALLDEMLLGRAYTIRMKSLRDLTEAYDAQVAMLEREIHGQLVDHPGYRPIQAIEGVGRVFGAIFVAETATSAASLGPRSKRWGGPRLRADFHRIAERRGRPKARGGGPQTSQPRLRVSA